MTAHDDRIMPDNEDRSFQKFMAVCFIFGFISLLVAGYVYAFGIPSFSNLDEERSFCFESGGQPMEPSRQTYNTMLCIFYLNDTYVEYGAKEITNEEWAEHFGKEVGDYCFSCWNSRSCASPHNDILRERGLHC